jgi:hypothetical protein
VGAQGLDGVKGHSWGSLWGLIGVQIRCFMQTEPPLSRAGSLPQEEQTDQLNRFAFAFAFAFAFDLQAPLTTTAERRHCAVGIPAWMPG